MQRIEGYDPGQPPAFDFDIYLRTGRRIVIGGMGDDVEVKFNPWHDPDNGQFTFVGQGRYYGRGGGGL